MNYQMHRFNVEHLAITHIQDRMFPRDTITEVVMPFVRGSQRRINERADVRSKIITYVPCKPIDYLKKFLILVIPSLDFGWLSPNMEPLVAETRIVNQEIYNIYPVKNVVDDSRRPYLEFVEMSPIDFLLGEPPTEAEIMGSKGYEIAAKRMAGRDISHFMRES